MATSVVLVVWNQLELTRACRESLRACTTPFELGVVDNGSTDGTGEWLDPQQRHGALRRFATKWRHRLPRDVRTPWRRLYECCPPGNGTRGRS